MPTGLFDMPTEPRITEMSWPTKIVLGPGAVQRLPAQVKRLNMKRPLIVSDQGVVKAGLVQKVIDVLKQADIAYELFDKVEPNPTEKDAFDGLEAYRKGKCDGFIGIGGGSPLDAMKLIQVL